MQIQETSQDESAKKPRVITLLKYPLPSPRLSFERQFELIRAYVAASKDGKEPIGYNDFGKLTVSPTNVSANNKFFEHLNLITRVEGGKYLPSEDAIEICRDLSWKKEDRVKSSLARIVSKSWFGESAKTLLSTKERVTEDELLEHLGYDSGADPKKHTPSLRVLIEYLKFAELVKSEDGFLTASSHALEGPSVGPAAPTGSVVRTDRSSETPEPVKLNSRILIGFIVTPDMTEEQVRKIIKIVLEETKGT